MESIPLSRVLGEVNRAHSVFSITYRTAGGDWGEKKNCVSRGSSDNPLTERKKMNRDGKLKLMQKSGGHIFEVFIDLLLTFNGQKINHFA